MPFKTLSLRHDPTQLRLCMWRHLKALGVSRFNTRTRLGKIYKSLLLLYSSWTVNALLLIRLEKVMALYWQKAWWSLLSVSVRGLFLSILRDSWCSIVIPNLNLTRCSESWWTRSRETYFYNIQVLLDRRIDSKAITWARQHTHMFFRTRRGPPPRAFSSFHHSPSPVRDVEMCLMLE